MLRFVRSFSVSRAVFAVPAKGSSCKAGTVLGLKIKKSGDGPVALEDSEYPEWLWDMLDKPKMEQQLKDQDHMKWRKKQLRKENIKRINNNNFLSKM
ncbi:large ribosomal subunit protein mL54 [Diutina catenulata]